jgi:hypothetical protein
MLMLEFLTNRFRAISKYRDQIEVLELIKFIRFIRELQDKDLEHQLGQEVMEEMNKHRFFNSR